MLLTAGQKEFILADDNKEASLRRFHALNRQPQAVSDEDFAGANPFFDPRDLVQVKYEMLRRVQRDGRSITETAAAFGFSRPSFYQAQAAFANAGLMGLVPDKPGPKRAHKLSSEMVEILEVALGRNPKLNSAELAELLAERGLQVHRRSVERALARRKKAPARS